MNDLQKPPVRSEFEAGFNYAMSLVISYSTTEYLSGRMEEETFKFIKWMAATVTKDYDIQA